MEPIIKAFFDSTTGTISYVVADKLGGRAAIIDSVLDYNPKSGRTSTASADAVIAYIHDQQLTVDWLLETHAHADHLSAAHYLRTQVGGKIAIGERITLVQQTFKQVFNLDPEFATNGAQFDYLFKDNESFKIGDLTAHVFFVPGHTPADTAFRIGKALFVGDTLFMPDVGTARCDFPGGDANALYASIQKILSFPDDTQLYMCHDYPPKGRDVQWVCTVADQKASNIHVNISKTQQEFIQMRTARDKTLDAPTLLLPSIQVNIRAGELPPKDSNGVRYLRIPLNQI